MVYNQLFRQNSLNPCVWEFHRNLLEPKFRPVYDSIVKALEDRKKEVDILNYNIMVSDHDDIYAIGRAIHYDYPIFFDFNRISSYYYTELTNQITNVVIEYANTDNPFYDNLYKIHLEQCIRRAQEIYSELNIAKLDSEYEIVKRIHDYLTESTVWAETRYVDDNHSILGVLLNGHGVCDSIAFTVSFLLNSFGVRCSCISGTDFSDRDSIDNIEPTDQDLHAWNIVEISDHNGKMHRGHLDIGFDYNDMNPPRYDYFMISDDECALMRRWDIRTNCDDYFSYFSQNNSIAWYDSYFNRVLSREIEQNKTDIHIKIMYETSREELYLQCDEIINTLYVDKSIRWFKSFNEKIRVFTVRIRHIVDE